MSGCKCTPRANWVLVDGTPYNLGTVLQGGRPTAFFDGLQFAGDSRVYDGHDVPDTEETYGFAVRSYFDALDTTNQISAVGGAGPNDWKNLLQVSPSKPARTQAQQDYYDWYIRQPFYVQLFVDKPV